MTIDVLLVRKENNTEPLDETTPVLKTFIICLENLLSLKVKVIRCDNGTEFKNSVLNQLCRLKGIKREFSVPRTPQQNGIAERKNRTLVEAIRTLLADSLLPISFWAEAVNTACYVQNRVLVTKPHNKTLYELLHGRLPSIGFMRPFGYPKKNNDALVDGKEHDDDIQKSVSPDIHSSSSGAQTRKQGYKTENKDKGKSHVVTITGFRDLNVEFEECTNNNSNGVNATSSSVSTAGHNFINSINDFSAAGPSNTAASPIVTNSSLQDASTSSHDSDMPNLEDLTHADDADDVGAEADINNLESIILVSPIPTTRIHKDHPTSQIIGNLSSTNQTRSMARAVRDQDELNGRTNLLFRSLVVATSSTEAEYVAAASGYAQVLWIQNQLLDYRVFNSPMLHLLRVEMVINSPWMMFKNWLVQKQTAFDDAEGVVCLPNEKIFAGLAQMGYEKPSTKLTFYKAFFSSQWKFLIHTLLQSLSAKRTSWNEFSTAMVLHLKFYMYPRFIQLIIQNQIGDLSSHTTSYISLALTKKVFENMRWVGKGFSGVETPLFEGMLAVRQLVEEGITEEQVQADAAIAAAKLEIIKLKARVKRLERANKVKSSKLRRLKKVGTSKRIESSRDMEDVFNQGRMLDDLDKDEGIELVVDQVKDVDTAKTEGRHAAEQAEKQAEIYHLDLDHPSKVLSMQEDDSEVSDASATISAAKPSIPTAAPTSVAAYTRRRKGVIIRDSKEELSSKTHAETPKLKDKGKCILIETPKPMKKKDQIKLDTEYARKLHEEINKDHEEINTDIDWDAEIDHNNVGYKLDFFKGMLYDEICPIFQARFNANMRFLFKSREEMEEEDQEVLKSINETPAQKATKQRKLNKEAQEVEDLKKHLEVVDDEDDDVFTEATPLARKVPVVDYQIVLINNKPRFKIIKADETQHNELQTHMIFGINGKHSDTISPSPKDSSDPTTAMNMTLALLAKAFKVDKKQINNNQRSSLIPRNSQIAQPGMNTSKDIMMQMADDNIRNQVRHNKVHYDGNEVGQNAVPNLGIQIVENIKGLSVVLEITNQYGNGNIETTPAEGNGNGINGNPIRIQSTQEEFEFMAAADAYEETKRVKVNCTSKDTLQQASKSGTQSDKALVYDSDGSTEVQLYDNFYNDEIFNMFTQEEQYTELLDPIHEPHQVQQNNSNVTSSQLGKQITALNEEISNLNKQLSKENSTVSSLREEKKRLKYDFKIREDELLDKHIQLENKIKKLDNILVKTGQSIQTMYMLSPKPDSFYHSEYKMALGYQNPFYLKQAQYKQHSLYNGTVLLEKHNPHAMCDSKETLELAQENFKSLAKEVDESLAKHKSLEYEIKRLLRAVVSQDIMSIVQSNFVANTSNLETELECTKERFENCIIKKENEYAKLWNDWYEKCEECKYDKISYDKAYNDMQQKIIQLQAQLGDLKGKSKDTLYVSNTLDPLSGKLEDENVSLEFQEKLHDTIYENATLRAHLFDKVYEQKDTTKVANQKKHKPKVKKPRKVGSKEKLASPKPSKPRNYLMWSPTGRIFDLKGKIIASRESECQSDSSNGDNACTSNPQEPTIKRFPNNTSFIGRPGKKKKGISPTQTYSKLKIEATPSPYGFVWSDESQKYQWKAKITVLLQALVIIVRTDNGTRLKNQVFKEYLDSVGMSHQAYYARTPQQNGVVERRNWMDLCYPKNDSEDIRKLDAKGDIGFFIGYSATSCAYRVFNQRTKKIMKTMNVTFDELSTMTFEQRSSKPRLQGMSSGQINTAPTPTNSFPYAADIPNSLQDVDELEPKHQHVQQQDDQAQL
uniref:Putative ribonuclease H-like domain-containing protein n=1 Tax=Tanacetum cinerariifolium TaxID=118510 RepID=A0A6L2JQU8_TANCI|nr:putative ribonuclease H-like domain-containing protein [Tanacetum cinerariifolium]